MVGVEVVESSSSMIRGPHSPHFAHSLAPELDDLPATHGRHTAALSFDHVPPSHL